MEKLQALTAENARILTAPVLKAGRSHQFSGITEVLKSIRELCSADGCVLWLWTEQGPPDSSVLFAAAEDFEGSRDPFWHYLSRDSPTSRAVIGGSPRNFKALPEQEVPEGDLDLALMRRLGVHSFCAIPIWWPNAQEGEKAIGSVNFYRCGSEPFEQEEFLFTMELAHLVPQLLATIINHASFHLLRQVSDLLHQAKQPGEGELRSFPPELRTAATQVLRKVRETFNCMEASIYLHEPGETNGTLHLVSTIWPWGDRPQPDRYAYGVGLTGYAAKTCRPLCIFDLGRFADDLPYLNGLYPGIEWSMPFDIKDAARELLPKNSEGKLPPLSFLAAPIAEAGQTLGVLRLCVAQTAPYYFNKRQLELLSLVADEFGDWCGSFFRLQKAYEKRNWLQAYVEGISELNMRVREVLKTSRQDLDSLYQKALTAAAKAVPEAYSLSIHLADEGHANLVFEAGLGPCWDGTKQETLRRKSAKLPLKGDILSAPADAFNLNRVIRIDDFARTPYQCSLFPDAEAMVVAPISSGSTISQRYGILGILFAQQRHLSEQAVAVAELLGRQLGLYRFLGNTIGDLRNTKDELERTVELQLQTFENLQHQLKTPVFLAHRIARRLTSRPSTQNAAQQIMKLKGQIRRTEQIVTNIRLFADLARGNPIKTSRLGLSEDKLLERLDEVVRDHGLLLDPDRGINFVIDRASFGVLSTTSVWLDFELLDQMLDNLLDNACKYSDSRSTVVVRGGLTHRAQYFFISISNRGIKTPVTAQSARHLAERGLRGDTPIWRGQEGSGLGLYIVRELLASHDGKLEIIPTNENGITDFRLLFPTGPLKLKDIS